MILRIKPADLEPGLTGKSAELVLMDEFLAPMDETLLTDPDPLVHWIGQPVNCPMCRVTVIDEEGKCWRCESCFHVIWKDGGLIFQRKFSSS